MRQTGPKYYVKQILYAKNTKESVKGNERYTVVRVIKQGRHTYVDVEYIYNGQKIILKKKNVKLFRRKQR